MFERPTWHGKTVLALVLAAVVAGCGSGASATGNHASAASAAHAKRAARRDRRHARAIWRFYGRESRAHWLIKSVTVHGGSVRVQTNLYPKKENRPYFTGACTWLENAYPWMREVTVMAQAGVPAAGWTKGNLACQIYGLLD